VLIGVELVQEFVESVILTGRLKDHEPASALLIGAPESGKTSIVNAKHCKSVAVFSDVTGKGLVEICKAMPDVTHIILNDLVAMMSHKQNVNRYTLAIINALTEEGLESFATPGGIEMIKKGKRGVIACLTHSLAKDGRSWWNKTGFSSRMIPFAFSHSASLTLRIKAIIDDGPAAKNGKKSELRIPSKPMRVLFPRKMVNAVRGIADRKASELNAITQEQGYRRLNQFRSLVCGHALRRTFRNPQVGIQEIEFLERILPYISYEKMTAI
jgi:hypothetical protein